MQIAEQQSVADELLSSLEIIAPHAILAGGAPRDWYMNNPAVDLDIYFSTVDGLPQWQVNHQLKRVLPPDCVKVKTSFDCATFDVNPMYEHMKGLKRIHYYQYKGTPVQFVQMKSAGFVYNAVDNFDCSICKVWYKNSRINPTRSFLKTLETKTLTLSKEYKWTDPHPKKMLERFSNLGFIKS